MRKANGVTFIQDFTYCDGGDPAILASQTCYIPTNTFITALYGLQWGQDITAKVLAYNLYGDSAVSLESTPLMLMTEPDAPVSLTENIAQRSFTKVTFTWLDGASFNGSPIIDYTISVAVGVGATDYSVLQAGVQLRSYAATSLTIG